MSYKPDESTLISYLYGELGEAEKENVQRYLQENPAARKAMQERAEVMEMLSKLEDKEVIAPPILMENETHTVSFLHHGPFKTILGIAASLLLILVAAKFLGTDIHYAEGELRISFGGVKQVQQVVPDTAPSFSKQEVQQMIDASLVRNNETMVAELSAHQKKQLDEAVRLVMSEDSEKINDLIAQVSNASQNQVRDYVYTLQNENVRLMKDYMTLSASEQKLYMENLLTDFAGYLQKQHEQDLVLVESRVNNIEQNTDQFKQATEQILASIISGKTNNSENNY
jgi:hypothetical protein